MNLIFILFILSILFIFIVFIISIFKIFIFKIFIFKIFIFKMLYDLYKITTKSYYVLITSDILNDIHNNLLLSKYEQALFDYAENNEIDATLVNKTHSKIDCIKEILENNYFKEFIMATYDRCFEIELKYIKQNL